MEEKDYTKYDRIQLTKGAKVELEHTDDIKTAIIIASDHLDEFPDYYIYLDEMEKDLKAKESTNIEENAQKMFGKTYKDLTPEEKKKVDDEAMVSLWLGEKFKETGTSNEEDEWMRKMFKQGATPEEIAGVFNGRYGRDLPISQVRYTVLGMPFAGKGESFKVGDFVKSWSWYGPAGKVKQVLENGKYIVAWQDGDNEEAESNLYKESLKEDYIGFQIGGRVITPDFGPGKIVKFPTIKPNGKQTANVALDSGGNGIFWLYRLKKESLKEMTKYGKELDTGQIADIMHLFKTKSMEPAKIATKLNITQNQVLEITEDRQYKDYHLKNPAYVSVESSKEANKDYYIKADNISKKKIEYNEIDKYMDIMENNNMTGEIWWISSSGEKKNFVTYKNGEAIYESMKRNRLKKESFKEATFDKQKDYDDISKKMFGKTFDELSEDEKDEVNTEYGLDVEDYRNKETIVFTNAGSQDMWVIK